MSCERTHISDSCGYTLMAVFCIVLFFFLGAMLGIATERDSGEKNYGSKYQELYMRVIENQEYVDALRIKHKADEDLKRIESKGKVKK